jgi:hypothetical protein
VKYVNFKALRVAVLLHFTLNSKRSSFAILICPCAGTRGQSRGRAGLSSTPITG